MLWYERCDYGGFNVIAKSNCTVMWRMSDGYMRLVGRGMLDEKLYVVKRLICR